MGRIFRGLYISLHTFLTALLPCSGTNWPLGASCQVQTAFALCRQSRRGAAKGAHLHLHGGKTRNFDVCKVELLGE